MKDKMTNIPLHFFLNSIFYLNFIEKLFRENNSKTKPQEDFSAFNIYRWYFLFKLDQFL